MMRRGTPHSVGMSDVPGLFLTTSSLSPLGEKPTRLHIRGMECSFAPLVIAQNCNTGAGITPAVGGDERNCTLATSGSRGATAALIICEGWVLAVLGSLSDAINRPVGNSMMRRQLP